MKVLNLDNEGAGDEASDMVQEVESTSPFVKEAHIKMLAGLNLIQQGNAGAAVDQFQEAFIAFIRAPDRKRAAMVQKVITLLLENMKDRAKADLAYQRSRDMLQRANLYDEEARVLMLRARHEARASAWDKAYRWLREALSVYHRIGHGEGEIQVLCYWAELEAKRGKVAEAKKHLAMAAQALETITDPAIKTKAEHRLAIATATVT